MTAECPTCYHEGSLRIGKSDREVYECETEECPVESFILEVSNWNAAKVIE